MNTSHYPSLELCKKLTEAGFSESEKYEIEYPTEGILYNLDEIQKFRKLVKPSVMELLDEMPDTIAQEYLLHFWKNNDRQYGVAYQEIDGRQLGESGKGFETLPNALAEMWLWLKENKFIN